MGFWSKLKGLLTPGSARAGMDTGLYYYLRCRHCREKLRVRADRRWDFQQEFDEVNDRVSGYALNKDVVGQKCFRMIRLELRFDSSYRETERNLEGAEFISQQEYESADA